MCSSQDPSITDERTTTESWTANYKGNVPWELTGDCIATTDVKIGLFIQRHIDFSSELCNAHKHISMQQQKQYIWAEINIFKCIVIHPDVFKVKIQELHQSNTSYLF